MRSQMRLFVLSYAVLLSSLAQVSDRFGMDTY
jgi:hypothetical protein